MTPGRVPLNCRLAESDRVSKTLDTNLLDRVDSKRITARGFLTDKKTFAHVEIRSVWTISDKRSIDASGTAPRKCTIPWPARSVVVRVRAAVLHASISAEIAD